MGQRSDGKRRQQEQPVVPPSNINLHDSPTKPDSAARTRRTTSSEATLTGLPFGRQAIGVYGRARLGTHRLFPVRCPRPWRRDLATRPTQGKSTVNLADL